MDYNEIITEGATVILDMGDDGNMMVTVTKGASLQNKRGVFSHDSFIGQKYGCKVTSHNATSSSGIFAQRVWISLCTSSNTAALDISTEA